MWPEETIRNCADCPPSVVSISAMLAPSQSRLGSPDAFRNGTIASETTGPEGLGLEDEPVSFPRKKNPTIASITIAAMLPTQCQGISLPHVRTGGKRSVAAAPHCDLST